MECCKAGGQMISPKFQFDHMNATDTGGTQLFCYMEPRKIKSLVQGRSRGSGTAMGYLKGLSAS